MELFPSADANLLSGNNGQGKTNLLESIFLLGFGKSFRTGNLKECIQHGQSECWVEGTAEHGSLSRTLRIVITNTDKKFFLLGKQVPFDEFLGNLHLLAFTREHLNVVRGSPADRRAFLDRAMVTLFPGHVYCLANYMRGLKQRNRVLANLKEGGGICNESLLESWDEALVKHGARILWNRMQYVEQMKEELPPGLFGTERLSIRYISTIADEPLDLMGIENRFRSRLVQSRANDRRTGFTSVGPHRDDLKLFINDRSLVDFGSSGQQRSFLLSLYFSQMEIHRKTHGFYPVFLVDDAEAELDTPRIQAFLEFLSKKTQTFLTSSKDFLLYPDLEKAMRFEVKDGDVHPR